MDIVTLSVGDLETNGYLVRDGDHAVVIDPGAEPERFVAGLEQWRCEPAAILLTHGHGDHIGAVAEMRERYPDAPVICHPADAPMLTDPELNLGLHFAVPLSVGAPDRLIEDGDTVAFGALKLRVIHIPGHTPGHVVFLHDGGHVFAGDTLFAGSIGRWDFPGGDGRALIDGIREKLLPLPDDTRVYPGHGPATTIGVEKRINPYLQPDFLKSFGFNGFS
ncbi:MAG: hypothetical protein MAG453_00633 [Calditrichaeota bacterium]|nr:hypothetical protein [Calditrichota bacterium]